MINPSEVPPAFSGVAAAAPLGALSSGGEDDVSVVARRVG